MQLVSVRSFVIMSRRTEQVYAGTLEDLDREAKGVFRRNMAVGWWGIPAGIYWTAVALGQNRSRMKKLHEYAEQLEASQPAQASQPPPSPAR